MSVIKKMRKQAAILWTRKTEPDDFGKFGFNEPVQIKCRWDEKTGTVVGKTGEIMSGMDTVYVDREVRLGDKLKKGSMDSTTPDDPLTDKEAFEIEGIENIPNFKAKEFLHIAYL